MKSGLKLVEDQNLVISLNQVKEQTKFENRKRPEPELIKKRIELSLAQPAYNTVYCDHAAFENDDQF